MKRASSTNAAAARDAANDAELMARLARGDLSALGTLYDRHHADVRGFVARLTGGSADLDDLVQETFLGAVQVAHRYDGRASAKPLLLGIATQHVRRRRRGVARLAEKLAAAATTLGSIFLRTPEDAAGEHEELERFNLALEKLTLEKRVVFLMIERDGLTGEEVASALDIPVNTVWTRLHYAWRDLRAAMGRRG